MVFVDNSGSDFIFGILPFVRFLLSQGSQVVIAANTYPSVNDITAVEIGPILAHIKVFDPIIAKALDGSLQVVPSGSGSPCLNLLKMSEDLALASQDVDLVVIEGMGRAIHTNFYAKFSVDALKVAVFKNPQIAQHLNASIYDGMVLFEPAH